MGDDKYGEVKTDADGNVDVDELEKYNPIKNKHQQTAKVAPSTEKEINSRGLFNPFALEENKSLVSEAKELAWIDKCEPSKEVRVTDDGGYVTIMQKDFEGRVIRVLIDTNQIPQLIAALKKAK